MVPYGLTIVKKFYQIKSLKFGETQPSQADSKKLLGHMKNYSFGETHKSPAKSVMLTLLPFKLSLV